MLKVSLVTNIYTPYRESQFKKIKLEYPSLQIYFTGDKRENRHWEDVNESYYNYLDRWYSSNRFGSLNKGLLKIIKKTDILIIGGYEQPSYIFLAFMARMYGVPTILLFDGLAPSRIHLCKNNLKFYIKNMIIKNFKAFWVNGEISKRYFSECFGVKMESIFNQYLTVDDSIFRKNLSNKNKIKLQLREKLNINLSDKIILYSGRFINRKRVTDIIEAIHNIQKKNIESHITLLLIGDKEEKKIKIYKDISNKYNINLIFGGFIEQSILYQYYYCSDLLVLPSEDEPWGLVVNEAVYSEIPILISNDCGSAFNLVYENKNGCVYNCGAIDEMTNKMNIVLNLNEKTVQKTSKEIYKEWTFENSVKELKKAIKYVTKRN